jgi:hypothetical protein
VEEQLDLRDLDGASGFRLDGEASFFFSGGSVSDAGDINGDGFDDILIGAPWADAYGYYTGATYVVFGTGAGFPATLDLLTLNGSNGFRVDGHPLEGSGRSVGAAGDVNGDGFDDLIIGAPGSYYSYYYSYDIGAGYVVFGGEAPFAPILDLAALDSSDGFRIASASPLYDVLGFSVSGAGDFNGDGFDDVIVGRPWGGAQATAGAAYIVFGDETPFPAEIDVSWLNGTNGFTISGAAAYDAAGFSVSAAGDVNGDGLDDLIVGAPFANTNGLYSGAAYVVFGRSTPMGATLSLSALNGSNGFRIDGGAAGETAGLSVSAAGDINGDGYDDVIVGADQASPNGVGSGSSYVVFGSGEPFPSFLEVSTLDGTNGFRIDGAAAYDYFGYSVSGAGDFNGDGFDDLIVGAAWAGANDVYPGRAYVVYGTDAGFPETVDVSSLNSRTGFVIEGVTHDDWAGFAVSAAGDINDDGFDDLVIGAPRADPYGNLSGSSYVVFGRAALGSESDTDGDRCSDIVWQNNDGSAGVWLVHGTTVDASAVVGSNPGPTWHIRGTGDFNLDDRSDIVWQHNDGRVAIWSLNGMNLLGAGVIANNPGPSWHIIDTGHFNTDGKSDLLWQNDDGRVAVWTLNGTTQTGSAVVGQNPGPAWHVKASGDFNGDGESDVLWQNADGRAAVWLLDGTNFVSGGVVGANPGASWHIKDSGDFNGDGKSDILWQNDDGRAGIWFLDGLTFLGGSVVGSNAGPSWQAEVAADYNGDGKSDILWQHDNGQAGIWLMSGFNVLDSDLVGVNPGPNWHVDWT